MALVICCPCGNPIDYEHIELVVSLTCPQCKRELDLEIEAGPPDRRRAVLTIMDGPHWVGERFLLPIGVELNIGQASGNWIALDDNSLSGVHCRLKLMPDGSVVVQDRQSKSGTWIGNQRVAQARLVAKQSMRIGKFRFRLDYEAVDGSTILASPAGGAASDSSGLLPTMAQVRHRDTALHRLITNRFPLSRAMIVSFGWTMGLYHALAFHSPSRMGWHWPVAIFGGLVIVALMALAGRRVTMAHNYFRFAPLALLLALAIADFIWKLPVPAIGCLCLTASLSLLVFQTPSPVVAALAGGLGITGELVVLIAAIRALALTLS